jgi:ATP-dependent Clp protease protease subunit
MIDIRHVLAAGLVGTALTTTPLLADTTEAPAAETTESVIVEIHPDSAENEKDAVKTEIERLRKEKDRLAAEYELLLQKQRNEMVQLELEKQRLQAEAQVRQSRQSEDTSSVKAELERLNAESQLRQAEQEAALAEIRTQVSRMQADRQLADAQREQELRAEAQRLDAQNQLRAERVEAAKLELQEAQTESDATLTELRRSLELRSEKDRARELVLDDLRYASEPFNDGVLSISDRRIALNGPIITGTADWVCERIHFFNNESNEHPIFIVIDNCPGGSVMQGYRIVKAIEESPAPVHVVVKSYAASMAAIITTLADDSYAYPNAIILHHQMSSGMGGNMTQLAEQLENAREWERRLGEPVAAKMGVSLDEFRRLMYENNSNGDWEEFADEAVNLKWVNHVVTEIREDGIRKRPTSAAPRPWYFALFGEADSDQRTAAMNALQRDEKGRPFMQLPPLQAFDHYFMYDPNNFYRY